MNILNEKITNAEKKFGAEIDYYVKACFKDIWLPSHDLFHHRRVWSFAKDLLAAYERNKCEFSNEFIEGLMVACYFHDVGMIKTIAAEHGEASAKIANEFITNGIVFGNDSKGEVLKAIKNHDNKEYLNNKAGMRKPSIYTLLTVADDLDAFGALGLYRYIEIYQMRHVNYKEMRTAILTNVKKRFNFVQNILKVDNSLQKVHDLRYRKVIDFAQAFKIKDFKTIGQLIEMKGGIETHSLGGLLADFQAAINDELKRF